MILFVGQVGRRMLDREAFQEIDYRRMYGQLSKWVAQIDDAERIPEYVSRAFHTATSGRPGPVVLALPEDMLTDRVTPRATTAYRPAEPHPGPADMASLHHRLAEARAPLMILGGGGWDSISCAQIRVFAENNDLPVGCSFRCQDYFDNRHPNYVGHVGIGLSQALRRRVIESDLLIVVGARLGEITTDGYTLLDVPRPKQSIVHIHPGAEELGRVYQADLPINASPRAFAAALAELEPLRGAVWATSTAAGHRDYLATLEPQSNPGAVQMGSIARWLNDTLPDDVLICNGAVIMPPGCSASSSIASTAISLRPPAVRWGMACRRRLPPSLYIRIGSSSA